MFYIEKISQFYRCVALKQVHLELFVCVPSRKTITTALKKVYIVNKKLKMLGEKHIYKAAKLGNILYTLYNLKETIHLLLKKLIVLRMSLIYLLFQPDLIGGPKALNWNHLSKLIFKQQYSKKKIAMEYVINFTLDCCTILKYGRT